MVNNAGVALENARPKPIFDFPEDVWDATMAVNAKGVFLGCKYAAAQMVKQEPHPCGDRGWIVNLASVLGLGGSPYIGKAHRTLLKT
jgi:NAD(P)-dependent dehydrogenase (short-subunit alcohol dehydrogenase family)